MIRVSNTEPNPTHHISFEDRAGKKVGLILCDEKGRAFPTFSKTPVERTSLKTSTGNSSYADLEYPYAPIAQDNWAGGRGSLDLERDATKFFDSFRVKTSSYNKVFLGPQEQFTRGYRKITSSTPGNVTFQHLAQGSSYQVKFTATASYTATSIWLLLKRIGSPSNLNIYIKADSGGSPSTTLYSTTLSATRLTDITSEWVQITVSQSLTSSTSYWIVVTGSSSDDINNCWKIGCNSTTPYYRVLDTTTNTDTKIFNYRECMYMVENFSGSAPKLHLNGDRGACDANTGTLTKLIDATKSWTTDAWAGCIAKIIDGTGKGEYRTIVSNNATQLTVDTAWTTEHTTSSDYVILGSNIWSEITGHGMNYPITDVLVHRKQDVEAETIYFAMGEKDEIMRYRGYTSGGSFKSEWRQETLANNKADLLTYMPITKKIVKATNSDSKVELGDPEAWGTDITFTSDKMIGSTTKIFTKLECYPDSTGAEAVWAFKTDIPYIIPSTGSPYQISIQEMKAVESDKNGIASLVHDVYIYFSLMNGLERYYDGNLDDVGPNTGEGLPDGRNGNIVDLVGYPGKFFAAVDAGDSGYSTILEFANNGWHERYRAPLGERIKHIDVQPIPGLSTRMWIFQGKDIIWIPLPLDTTNELEDNTYKFTHEGHIVLSRMHAGMMDVQKLVKTIKLWSDNLEEDVCWFELDYRLDDSEGWSTFDTKLYTSPQSEHDLESVFAIAAKRIQLRIRFFTTDAFKTPILMAVIVDAVMRINIKYMYPIMFRIMDKEETLIPEEADDIIDGVDKFQILQDWADSGSDSMLKVHCISKILDGKMMFLNPPDMRQIRVRDHNHPESRDIYICQATLQEA